MKPCLKKDVKGFIRKSPIMVMIVIVLLFEIILQFDMGETIWGLVPNRLLFSVIVFFALYAIYEKKLFYSKISDYGFALACYGYFILYAIVSEIVRITQLHYEINFTISSLIEILTCLILSIIVGFVEEGVYRGIVLNGFINVLPKTKKGLYLSVVLSGLFFGISHVWYSFFEIASNPVSVIAQIFETTISVGAVGILIASIYLKTKNIWCCIFVHALGDFLSFLFDILHSNQLNVQYVDSNMEMDNMLLVISFMGTIIKAVPYLIIAFCILKKISPIDSVLWKRENENVPQKK